MYCDRLVFPRRLLSSKPELPNALSAGSTVFTGIPSESNTAGSDSHTASSGAAIDAVAASSPGLILSTPPPASRTAAVWLRPGSASPGRDDADEHAARIRRATGTARRMEPPELGHGWNGLQ